MVLKVQVFTLYLLCLYSQVENNSSRFRRQNAEILGCLLPYPPPNGEFKILGSEKEPYIPNTVVEAYQIIDLSCKRGFLTETGGLARSICINNNWTPSLLQLGGCIRGCPRLALGTDILNISCTRNNRPVSCETPLEGTVAKVVCKPYFEFAAARPYTTCRNGTWDYETPCQAECGRKQIDLRFSALTTEQSTADFPWTAIIYKIHDKSYFCAANIISKRFLLSVAHAFTDAEGKLRGVDPYLVVVGKLYYPLNDNRDTNKQTSKITKIFVPKNYRDTQQNYVLDIAVLTLETPLVFDQYVQPVCIDWDNKYESVDLEEDNEGQVVAWGPSNDRIYLLNETVQYKNGASCSKYAPSSFIQKYLKEDKFCGFVDNRNNLCGGLAGAGLIFENRDSKFYIRGILSVGHWKSCTTNHLEIFTKVSLHLEEIANVTGRV